MMMIMMMMTQHVQNIQGAPKCSGLRNFANFSKNYIQQSQKNFARYLTYKSLCTVGYDVI